MRRSGTDVACGEDAQTHDRSGDDVLGRIEPDGVDGTRKSRIRFRIGEDQNAVDLVDAPLSRAGILSGAERVTP